MAMTKHLTTARTLGVVILATLSLGACATYDDEFATINSRLDQLDSRVASAAQSAESANQNAQRANSGWTKWKAASSSSKRNRVAGRAVSRLAHNS